MRHQDEMKQNCYIYIHVRPLLLTNSTSQIEKQRWILWIYTFMSSILEKQIPYSLSLATKLGFISMDT